MLGDKQKRFRIRFAPDTEPIFFRDVEEMHCEGRRGREFRRMHEPFRSRPERFPPGGRGAMPLPAGDFLSDVRHFAETGDAVVDVGVGAEQLGHAAAVQAVKEEYTRYQNQLTRSRTRYKIVEETTLPDDSILVKIKKQYNNHDCGDYLD